MNSVPFGFLASGEACRRLDAEVIDGLGVPGIALMELASRGVADVARRLAPDAASALVVCGSGNNGGDGWGAARWLHRRGLDVRVLPLGAPRPGSDADRMRTAALNAGVRVVDGPGQRASIVLDAVFGTGLTRPIEGPTADVLRDLPSFGDRVVAVDLPSGLCADTGRVLGVCPRADLTVTFGRLKPAFFTPGGQLAGRVELVDIGVHASDHACGEVPEPAWIARSWPDRSPGAYKNALGHLAIVAGSERMAGAAVLCALGALRSGVGLVTLFTTADAVPRLGSLPPTVMLRVGPVVDALHEAAGYQAVAVGPGLGGGRPLEPAVRNGLDELWRGRTPVVFDADALLPFDGHAGANVVRTPHPGEAGRLLGRTAADVEQDRFGAARDLARQGGVALLKGRHTLIAQGERLSVNVTGGPALATAGSGDVLTGVIGGLLARGLSAFDAARVGACVHGRAGELAGRGGRDGQTAEDINHHIPDALIDLRGAGA